MVTYVDFHDKLYSEHHAFREVKDKTKVNRNIWCCRFCGQVKTPKKFDKTFHQTCNECSNRQSRAREQIKQSAARMVRLDERKAQEEQNKKDNYIAGLGSDAKSLLHELKMRRDGMFSIDDVPILMRTYTNSCGMDSVKRYGPTFCGQLAQICYNMIHKKFVFENVNWDMIILR